jgi:hypothetical protein
MIGRPTRSLLIPQSIDQRHTGFPGTWSRVEQQNSVSQTGHALRLYRFANQLGDYLPHGHPVLMCELPDDLQQVIVDLQSGPHTCMVTHRTSSLLSDDDCGAPSKLRATIQVPR